MTDQVTNPATENPSKRPPKSGTWPFRFLQLLGLGLLAAAWYNHMITTETKDRRASRRDAFSSPSPNAQTSLGDPDAQTTFEHPLDSQSAIAPPDATVPSIANAQALIDRGLINEGSAMLEKLIQQEPSNTQALMEMAMVYTLDLKEPEKSRQILERIIDINPSHRAALNELELLYKELDAVDDGLALLELKAQQYPESLEIQYVYGRLLSSSDPRSALPWLERATKIPDQREQALDQLASAALRAGQLSLAVTSWSEALSLAERELEEAKAKGESGTDYLEDRITATRSELVKAQQQLRSSSPASSSRQ